MMAFEPEAGPLQQGFTGRLFGATIGVGYGQMPLLFETSRQVAYCSKGELDLLTDVSQTVALLF